jgi:hypothetical protein
MYLSLGLSLAACGTESPHRDDPAGDDPDASLTTTLDAGSDGVSLPLVDVNGAAEAAPAPDLPPGTCTSDEHCATPAAPLCESGACVACEAGKTNAASFVDESVPDGTSFKPGATFTKRWGIKNSGSSSWSGACGFSLGHLGGATLGAAKVQKLADLERVPPGKVHDWKVKLRAPSSPGTHTGYWQMRHDKSPFGVKVWVTIKVTKCASDADCLEPGKGKCQSDGSCAAPPCTSDKDCTDPLKPLCGPSGCVQCKQDADCPATAPKCQQGACLKPGTCGAGPKPVLGQTTWPVPTKKSLCQKFGNPISYQSCGFHTGIDVCTASGDPLLAIAAGKVVHVGYMWYSGASSGRGPYAVIIQHSPNFYSTYGHNQKALVKQGDCVTKGQKIAEVGSLGYSSGPHLHFEIVDGTPFTGSWQVPFNNACKYYVDPMKVIAP